ncbi:cytochrome-c oxidase, cbb3-type subunit III [Phyllobacterium phragmitis]|uniref:Cbb3-type cytochrome c oxidase subunit n=1 Tax=Phyllobacterium phragmitis TaxID=2670329 RepID=A0A2S9IMV3_9HYPH|nr:cytochrome-c oxidase, cbb3-type subunit III [Phyllobacterium phragmitis]PRD41859.1 cytochrome-c oxidase, cbb3-type subunit III [Phyllobacterium phragmitis]
MSEKHVDEVSGVSTTGHEWDGIRELDNPMPRWWLWSFYATIVWAAGYTIAYPAWPLISDATRGVLGYSSRADVRGEMAAAEAQKAGYMADIASSTVPEILANDALRQVAIAGGAAAFKVNCVQCHGSGAAGSAGYPNLNDDDWLWGGSPEAIQQTITHGIRFAGDDDTRQSMMPAFADILDAGQIAAVASFVASLSGTPSKPALVEEGRAVFADNCAVCHGADAKGNVELGAPNLTDALWLMGGTEAEIARQVQSPRHGIMPAWGARLGETTVKELTVFVHSLGGGQPSTD